MSNNCKSLHVDANLNIDINLLKNFACWLNNNYVKQVHAVAFTRDRHVIHVLLFMVLQFNMLVIF